MSLAPEFYVLYIVMKWNLILFKKIKNLDRSLLYKSRDTGVEPALTKHMKLVKIPTYTARYKLIGKGIQILFKKIKNHLRSQSYCKNSHPYPAVP